MVKPKAKANKAKARTIKPAAALSGHALVEALKDTHFRRAVKQEMNAARERLNRRMEQERYDTITQHMSIRAQRDFDARVRQLRGE